MGSAAEPELLFRKSSLLISHKQTARGIRWATREQIIWNNLLAHWSFLKLLRWRTKGESRTVQVVKLWGSSSTANSPYGQEHPRSSLPCRLTVDQLLTVFHQRAMLNQAYLQCRSPSGAWQVGLRANSVQRWHPDIPQSPSSRTVDPSASVD